MPMSWKMSGSAKSLRVPESAMRLSAPSGGSDQEVRSGERGRHHHEKNEGEASPQAEETVRKSIERAPKSNRKNAEHPDEEEQEAHQRHSLAHVTGTGSDHRKHAKEERARAGRLLDLSELVVPGGRGNAVLHEEEVIALGAEALPSGPDLTAPAESAPALPASLRQL